VLGEEDADDQHRAEIIDDRQGGEEDLQTGRRAAAEQGEHAYGKGDVGGHRDRPADHGRRAMRQRHIDQGRHDHAPDSGGGRQRGLAHGAQLAEQHLALDLESDQQEEDGHQAVVDPVVQVVADGQPGNGHAEVEVPEVVESRRPRRVGREQGQDHRGHQNQAAASRAGESAMQEVPQGERPLREARHGHPDQMAAPAATARDGGAQWRFRRRI